jgi:hypothetical protein
LRSEIEAFCLIGSFICAQKLKPKDFIKLRSATQLERAAILKAFTPGVRNGTTNRL